MAKGKRTVDDYTRAELYRMACEAKVKYRSRMRKVELFRALGLGEESPPAAAAPAAPPAAAVPGVTAAPAAAPSSTAVPVAGTEPAAGPYLDRGAPLPASYGLDRIEAMVRDPRWIHVYWELDGGHLDEVRARRGGAFVEAAAWVLRVHTERIEGGFYDVPVDAGARSWYLKVEPERRYRVVIGLVGPGGEFEALAASREIVTPREEMSERLDEEWMLVRADFEKLLEFMGGRVVSVPGSVTGVLERRRLELPRLVQFLSGRVPGSLSGSRAIRSGGAD